MKGALAVFVKTPELSPVKTRLAASLGKAAAVAVYAECLGLSADMMRELPADVKPFWAVWRIGRSKKQTLGGVSGYIHRRRNAGRQIEPGL